MSEFKMPADGTPAYDELKDRWSAKPITFGQCGRIKALFKQVSNAGGYAGKVNAKYEARLDYLSTRNEEGRWTVLRTDNADLKMSMWQAHLLMDTLETLANGDLTVAKTEPKPAPKVEIPATTVSHKSGDIIMIDGEAVVLNRNGNRFYAAKVPA